MNRVVDAPNPKAALAALSPGERRLFTLATTPYGAPKVHPVSAEGVAPKAGANIVSPMYSGCWGHGDVVEWQSLFG
ncbi:MAG: hypothetical protein HOY76_38505 [Streptomyces sp.]|nr:hypothetical protein [Streptomyces sp.]NUS10937.1 hypothetical protein [Streptomyces sp.]